MNRFLENLQRQAEEQPLVAMGIAAGLLTALSKLAGTRVEAKKASTNAREIDRRIRKLEKK